MTVHGNRSLDESRFISLWKRAGSSASKIRARAIFHGIDGRYREPHRRYHTRGHIVHCLCQLDTLSQDDPDKLAVELALWFHDVVYEIGDPNNEENSADWFRARAMDDLPEALIDAVCAMIIATVHQAPPTNRRAALTVDIDLSSFGLPYAAFIRDSQAVRDESPHLSDNLFYQGQRAFLERLTMRDQIFTSDHFNTRLEARARDNIAKTLEMIKRRFSV
ncbi:MAG: hypothetical protein DHS20C01_28380 [marine bacterium B5-7]|nr:MAG: hypothetical protein DHS20C01_28380 [marine bacterium B5-7]